jgi:hypothetical protein
VLAKNLELAQREAGDLGRAAAPYDAMLDKFDPGLTAGAVEKLFSELKRELVPLVRAITSSPVAAPFSTSSRLAPGTPGSVPLWPRATRAPRLRWTGPSSTSTTLT